MEILPITLSTGRCRGWVVGLGRLGRKSGNRVLVSNQSFVDESGPLERAFS
jgi:hypothetical protein